MRGLPALPARIADGPWTEQATAVSRYANGCEQIDCGRRQPRSGGVTPCRCDRPHARPAHGSRRRASWLHKEQPILLRFVRQIRSCMSPRLYASGNFESFLVVGERNAAYVAQTQPSLESGRCTLSADTPVPEKSIAKSWHGQDPS